MLRCPWVVVRVTLEVGVDVRRLTRDAGWRGRRRWAVWQVGMGQSELVSRQPIMSVVMKRHPCLPAASSPVFWEALESLFCNTSVAFSLPLLVTHHRAGGAFLLLKAFFLVSSSVHTLVYNLHWPCPFADQETPTLACFPSLQTACRRLCCSGAESTEVVLQLDQL